MGNPAKVHAPLTHIQKFGTGVYKLQFQVERRYTRFLPGQFLHLALDPFDPSEGYWPESRVFSICSSPRTDLISIVFSVKGKFTGRMERELKEGESYWLKLPYGDFIIDSLVAAEETIVLVAGGTGISPYIPFLENEINANSSRQIWLHYGLRQASFAIFEEVLGRACRSLPNFGLTVTTEDGSQMDASFPRVAQKKGLLCVDSVVEQVEDDAAVYFLSGPPVMIDVMKRGLIERRILQDKIKIDEWE